MEKMAYMVEDRLNNSLLNMGYQRLNSNAEGIYLYYRNTEGGLDIVSVIHALEGNEITSDQYIHVLAQIKDNMANAYPYRARLLSLIFTKYPDRIKHLCSLDTQDSHWIIDLSTNRLMIYETQTYDFNGIKGVIEQLLDDEQNQDRKDSPSGNQYGAVPNQDTTKGTGRSGSLPFTWINGGIIILNIIIYLITHLAPLFGGPNGMLTNGALSWYYVINQKEYYRIITAMFLHANLSHLMNNMFVLLFIGGYLEKAAGKLKYLFIYFGAGIIAGIASISYNMWKENAIFSPGNSTISIGASGAIFGAVGAILFIVIVNRGRLAQFNTRQMILFAALSLYGGIINSNIDQAAHFGGFLGGILLAAILYRRPGRVNRMQ